jgi:ribosomal protein L7Ae-like RNA K-turn-binding protein
LGSGTARLLILSDDVSANTRSALVAICSKRSVPYCTLGDKERLGASVGQAYRVALTIDDRGLARAILDAVREDNTVEVVEWPK